MSGTIINLIIQIIAGAMGGHAAGGILKNIDLSPLTKTISGAVGGGLGGTILQSLISRPRRRGQQRRIRHWRRARQCGWWWRHRRDCHRDRKSHQKCRAQKSLTERRASPLLAETQRVRWFNHADRIRG